MRQTLPAAQFAVAVVIDGVDETEAEYQRVLTAARADASYTLAAEFQANAGQSVARHRAIVAASTPWICVIDDDMDLAPEFRGRASRDARVGGEKTVVIDGSSRKTAGSPPLTKRCMSHMLEWYNVLGQRAGTVGLYPSPRTPRSAERPTSRLAGLTPTPGWARIRARPAVRIRRQEVLEFKPRRGRRPVAGRVG